MKTLHITLTFTLLLSLTLRTSANYIYHWIPTVSFTGLSSGFIEINDTAYAAGTFGLADIIDFEFVEPPFVLLPIYGETTWDIVLSATGTLTSDKQSIQTLTLTGAYSIPPALDLPPRQLIATFPSVFGEFRSTSPAGLAGFGGTWGDVTHVSTSVPDGGSTAGLLTVATMGIALLARKRSASA